MPTMMYFPRKGIRASQMDENRIRPYSLSGLGSLSAVLPPYTLPPAMAIMIIPMMMVQTTWDEEKYGEIRR